MPPSYHRLGKREPELHSPGITTFTQKIINSINIIGNCYYKAFVFMTFTLLHLFLINVSSSSCFLNVISC
jgi:hypothetical protein